MTIYRDVALPVIIGEVASTPMASGRRTSRRDVRRACRKRDGNSCFYCRVSPRETIHTDHVVPLCRGGADDAWNVVAACRGCNQRKARRLIPSPYLDIAIAEVWRRNLYALGAPRQCLPKPDYLKAVMAGWGLDLGREAG